jgi:hypothetical protein
MARGWESKAIEAQQEESGRHSESRPALTPEQRAAQQRRAGLELARARARDDLSRAVAPAHRRLLESTLQAIQQDLDALS